MAMGFLRGTVILLLRLFFGFYFFVFGRPKVSLALKKAMFLYNKGGFNKFFSPIRVWDAPFEEIESVVPKKGRIVDLGCGEGILTNFLALSSKKRELIGIELDSRRLALADKKIPNVTFRQGNAVRVNIPKCDVIILSHVLHHLPSLADQVRVLENCHKALKRGGKIIIAEVEPKLSFKYLLAWLTDHFLVPVLFEKKIYSPVYFRSREEWVALLKGIGFRVKWKDASQGKPFPHVLFYT